MKTLVLKIEALILSEPQNKKSGSVEVIEYEKKERLTRALRILALIWAGALICIFIPLLHFILVPAGLIAGPFIAKWIYEIETEIQSGTVLCPKCSQNVLIEKQKLRWPLTETCNHCHCEFKITPQ